MEELNQVLYESFSKFVPRDLVEELVAEGQLVRLRGEEREVTILLVTFVGTPPSSKPFRKFAF